jgi:AraC-like DNA-binding protein
MLIARGSKALREASLRWAIVFTRGGYFKLIESRGLALDTRFIPAAPGPPKPNVCLHLVIEGGFRAFGSPPQLFGPRTALALTLEQMEGAEDRRSFRFRTGGDPFLAIELHFDASSVRPFSLLPALVDLDAIAWAAAARATLLSQNDDAIVVDSLRELVTRLGAVGFLREEAAARALAPPPRPMTRLWNAVRPLIERMALAATRGDLTQDTGLSTHQAERTLQRWMASFALVGPGMRSLTRHLRLKYAVLFLTAPGATVADVAQAVGYGSPEAMAHAFRHAGLAAPREVQAGLLGETET